MGGFLPLGDVFWLVLGSFAAVLDLAAQLLLPRWYFPACFGQLCRGAGLGCPINFLTGSFLLVLWAAPLRWWTWLPNYFLAGSFLLVLWAAATLLALVLPNNSLAVVFSGLFWAALPRCWTWLPINFPRGKFFARTLGSSAAVLDSAAH